MAKKIERWVDNENKIRLDEEDALMSDLIKGLAEARRRGEKTDELRAAVDALHEYAHRADAKDNPPDTQKDQPARPTFDEVKALARHDEVMISGQWFKVHHASDALICVTFEGVMTTAFDITELVHICQGIRRRGQ